MEGRGVRGRGGALEEAWRHEVGLASLWLSPAPRCCWGVCEPPAWPPKTMLAVVGTAALVLMAGAPWVLPSAAGEPRGLGEGRAAGRES